VTSDAGGRKGGTATAVKTNHKMNGSAGWEAGLKSYCSAQPAERPKPLLRIEISGTNSSEREKGGPCPGKGSLAMGALRRNYLCGRVLLDTTKPTQTTQNAKEEKGRREPKTKGRKRTHSHDPLAEKGQPNVNTTGTKEIP